MLGKFYKNSRNSNPPEDTGRHEEAPEGTHQEVGALLAQPGKDPRHQGARGPGPPPGIPSAYIFVSDQKPPKRSPFLESNLCSTAVAILISGGDRRTCSGSLPEEEDHPGGLYVVMTASRMMCE